MSGIEIRVDPRPAGGAFAELWHAAWLDGLTGDPEAIWAKSLFHLGAYDGERLVGYVNVAGDGGIHAFILDPTVHPDRRRLGIGTTLVRAAADEARNRGCKWLHVDFEPRYEQFYRGCGFRATAAGVMRL